MKAIWTLKRDYFSNEIVEFDTLAFCCCSVAKSCLTFCDPWTTAHQASLSFTTHRVCLNSCLLSGWCHPTISSSVIPFSSCLQSFPASGSFPMSQLFASGGQSIGVSASASILPMNIQDWFPLGLTSWLSLLSKGLSRVFPSTTVQKHQFFGTLPSLCTTLTSIHPYMSPGKTKALTIWTFSLWPFTFLKSMSFSPGFSKHSMFRLDWASDVIFKTATCLTDPRNEICPFLLARSRRQHKAAAGINSPR